MANYNLTHDIILEMTRDQNASNKQKEAERLVEKWGVTQLLEGLNPEKKQNLAFLLENEAKELRAKILNEQTNVGDIAGFNKIAFPLVRRVFASLLTNDIVSVQPMQMPAGLVFYTDFTYDRTRAGQTAGGSVYGDRDTVQDPTMGGIGPSKGTGGFYDFAGLGYANRIFTLGTSRPSYASVTATSYRISGTLSGFDFTVDNANVVDWMSRYEMRPCLSGEINFEQNGINNQYSTAWNSFRSTNAIKSLSADSLATRIDNTLTEYPSGGTTVRIYSTANLAAASASAMAQAILLGRVKTLLQDSASTNGAQTLLGDFENTIEIPQINFKILSSQVSAQTKKLKTVWTPEMSQDLNAFMALDAEVELTNILSEQIATEIDREILSDLLSVAYVKAAWSRMIGRYVYIDRTGAIQDATYQGVFTGTQAFYGDQDQWHNTLGHVMNAVSNRIMKLNLRQGANWAVVGPQVSSIIETMGKQFASSDNSTDDANSQYTFGIEKIGTMNRWTIFKDPYFPEDRMLLGYKGKNALEGGYIWCPYIPLIVTPTIFNPDNFNPIKGCITRNGKTVIRNDYYGVIRILNLDFYTF